MAFAENLDVFLADFAVTLVKGGGQPFLGNLDGPDQARDMGHVNVISTEYVVRVKSSDIAANAITRNNTLTVSDSPWIPAGDYAVRDTLLLDDGAFSNITLSK